MDPNAINALYPGDLNKMFERIVNSPEYQKYEPKVVSQPPEGPWMIIFENMLDEEEAQRLIDLGGERGYERSAVRCDNLDDHTAHTVIRNVDQCLKTIYLCPP